MITEIQVSNKQKTIKDSIKFSGVGLHTGKESNVEIKPAPEDTGIIFYRTDVLENNQIKAIWSNVSNTKLSSNTYVIRTSNTVWGLSNKWIECS